MKHNLSAESMEEALAKEGLDGCRVISVVGAGGKSSLIRELAREMSLKGKRVLVTTTTHIYRPRAHLAETAEAAEALWQAGTWAVIGSDAGDGKLAAPREELYRELAAKAELVLIEADGARGYPCKVPAAHEPVIRPETELVIAVLGMSAVRRPLRACCFRRELLAEIFGADAEGILTEELAAELLASEKGGRKSVGVREFLVVLNQCEDAGRRLLAGEIRKRLQEKGVKHCMITSLRPDVYPAIAEYKDREDCLLATVLEGVHAGEKVLLCGGQIRWQGGGDGLLRDPETFAAVTAADTGGLTEAAGSRIFVERFGGSRQLIICGAGHVSMSLIRMGLALGFQVTVLEDRPAFADNARRAGAHRVICEAFEEALREVPESRESYYVVVTRGHRYDRVCLREILKREYAYAGMMGSRRRVAMLKESLLEEGADPEKLAAVHMPIGLSIGAETPEEIAVSVMAEIIQCKNKLRRTEGYRDEILNALEDMPAVLAEIVWRRGSAPRNVGTKMVIRRDGTTMGTIGGGCMEAEVIRRARTMLAGEERNCLQRVDMTTSEAGDEGMVCGGTELIYLEKRE